MLPLFRHRIASMKVYPPWTLVAWFIGGATVLSYLGLGYFVHSLSIHDRWFPLLDHLRGMIAGIAMGIVITLTIWYYLGRSRTVPPAVDSTSR